VGRFGPALGLRTEGLHNEQTAWSFIIGPDNLVYNSSNGIGHFVERFGHASLAVFTVRLSEPSATPVTVQFGTATAAPWLAATTSPRPAR
jgi:hypothetical protein